MKKQVFLWLAAAAWLLAACSSGAPMQHGSETGAAHGSGMQMPMSDQPAVKAGSLEIYAPRAMAGTTGQTTGGFLTIKNTGTTADRLLGASCGAAAMTQVHETVMDGDVMRMREVPSIEIPAGGMVEPQARRLSHYADGFEAGCEGWRNHHLHVKIRERGRSDGDPERDEPLTRARRA